MFLGVGSLSYTCLGNILRDRGYSELGGGIRSMEIWREGAREVGMVWDGGQRKEREPKVESWRVREATHWLSSAWPVITPGDPLLQGLRGESGTWRLGRHVSMVQAWPAVFRRFDITSYQITRESRVTATY
jgi:hypothetical protein